MDLKAKSTHSEGFSVLQSPTALSVNASSNKLQTEKPGHSWFHSSMLPQAGPRKHSIANTTPQGSCRTTAFSLHD